MPRRLPFQSKRLDQELLEIHRPNNSKNSNLRGAFYTYLRWSGNKCVYQDFDGELEWNEATFTCDLLDKSSILGVLLDLISHEIAC